MHRLLPRMVDHDHARMPPPNVTTLGRLRHHERFLEVTDGRSASITDHCVRSTVPSSVEEADARFPSWAVETPSRPTVRSAGARRLNLACRRGEYGSKTRLVSAVSLAVRG